MKEILLLTDKKGGKNIFDYYAREIEKDNLISGGSPQHQGLLETLMILERRIQDINEKIKPGIIRSSDPFRHASNFAKNYISKFASLFQLRNLNPSIVLEFEAELKKLASILDVENVKSMVYTELDVEFAQLKLRQENLLKSNGISKDDENVIENEGMVVKVVLRTPLEKTNTDNSSIASAKDKQIESIIHSEETVYTCKVKLWIDTKDPVEANRFTSIVASVLGNIPETELEILDSGIGSVWQEWKLKIKGWFAKEETKQIIDKGLKAAEAYSLDKFIEPIEKSKADRKKVGRETEQLFTKEQAEKLNEVKLEMAEEELMAKKLSNIEKQIEISRKLSELLSQGLISIDSDYRIEINNLLLIEQKDKKITKEINLLEQADNQIFDISNETKNPDDDEDKDSGTGGVLVAEPVNPKKM